LKSRGDFEEKTQEMRWKFVDERERKRSAKALKMEHAWKNHISG
jgi:hypothetical protein